MTPETGRTTRAKVTADRAVTPLPTSLHGSVTPSLATLQHVLSYCTNVPLAVAACTPGLRRLAERHRIGLVVASNIYREQTPCGRLSRHGAGQPVLRCQIHDEEAARLARWWLRRLHSHDVRRIDDAIAASTDVEAQVGRLPTHTHCALQCEEDNTSGVGCAVLYEEPHDMARRLQIYRDEGNPFTTNTTSNSESGRDEDDDSNGVLLPCQTDAALLRSPTTSDDNDGSTTLTRAQAKTSNASSAVCAMSLAEHISLGLCVDELVLKHIKLHASPDTTCAAALPWTCGLRVVRLHCVTLPTCDVQRLLAANCHTLRCLELAEMPLALPAQLPLAACQSLRELALLRPTTTTVNHNAESEQDSRGGVTGQVSSSTTQWSRNTPVNAASQDIHVPASPNAVSPSIATTTTTTNCKCHAVSFIAAIAQLPQLASLNLSGWPVPLELSPLAGCVALRGLILNAAAVSDVNVEEISQVRNLRSLLLTNTAVSSVHALSRCHFLHTLHLAHSAIDTSGLAGLERLESLVQLDLSHTGVTEVGALGACPRLSSLNLYGSAVTSAGLRGLERAPRLRHLFLGNTAVDNVAVLGESGSLEQIMLPMSHVSTSGLLGIERLTTLHTLSLAHTAVDDVRMLRVCTKLRVLDLRHSAVTSHGIAGLERIPSLTILLLSHSEVDDISRLAASRSLQEIELHRCRMARDGAGLVGIGNMSRLRVLSVTECQLSSLSDFGRCVTLRRLNLWGTQVTSTSLHTLASAQRLRQLDLADCDVDDITPLLMCSRLIALTLRNTRVASVEGLQGLRYLRKLNLAATLVQTVTCLQSCPALRILILSHTAVDDAGLCGVECVMTLRRLVLQGTRVSRIGLLGRCAQLQVLVARHCPVDAQGLVGLECATSLVRLDLSYTQLRNGIARLAACHQLRKLNLVFTDVPLAEVKELSAALPQCHVVHDAVERMRKRVTLLP